MQVGEAFITVRPDTAKFGPELTRETEAAGRQASSGLSQALTATIAVAGFSKLISSASDLEQAMGGTEAVFGNASAAIDEFAKTSADAVGLSEASYRQLASFAGNQLMGLGFSAEQAAEATNELITVGADAAATFGGTTQEAVQALSATFRNEFDPVEKYISGLRASTVAAKAVELGLADSTGEVDANARATATLALIQEKSATFANQFALEADTAAGAQQRAAAAAENSAASLGSNLLPAYQSGVAVVGKLAVAFGALPAPLQTAGLALGAFAAFHKPITGAFSAISGAVQAMAVRFREAGGGLAGLKAAISPGALGVGAAVVGIGLIANAWAEQNRRAQEAEDRMKALSEAFAEGGAAAAGDTLLTQIADQTPEAVDALNAAGVSTRDLVDAAAEGDGALEDLVGRIQEAGGLSNLTAIELGRLAEATLTAAGTSASLGEAQDANAEANGTAAMSVEELADAYSDLSTAVDDYLNKIQSTEEAAAGEAEAQQALMDALIANGHTFDVNTAKGRENIAARNSWVDAVGAQVQAAFDFAAAGGNVEVAQRRANNAVRSGIGDLQAMRDAGLITGAQFDRLREQMRRIPANIPANISSNVGSVLAQWQALPAAIKFAASTANAVNIPAGIAAPDNESASFVTGGAAESFAGGGGGPASPAVHVTVQGNVIGDVDRFADEIAYRAAEKIARTGGF